MIRPADGERVKEAYIQIYSVFLVCLLVVLAKISITTLVHTMRYCNEIKNSGMLERDILLLSKQSTFLLGKQK